MLVGCSGGADSLALAAAAVREARQVGKSTRNPGFAVRVGAVVVDHGMQDGSAEVAEAAAQHCRDLGIDPVLVRRVTVAGGGEGDARDARYAALDEVAQELDAKAVLLGHTLDDQAEQVILGLARGSGARSLAGIPPTRGIYLRPLLGITRAQTEAACTELSLHPWDDPTNADIDAGAPLRNQIRGHIMPLLKDLLGPTITANLARSADLLRDDADYLESQAYGLLSRAVTASQSSEPQGRSGRFCEETRGAQRSAATNVSAVSAQNLPRKAAQVVLDVTVLKEAHQAVRRRALRMTAIAVGAPSGSMTSRHVAAIDALVTTYIGQERTFLPSGATVHREHGTIVFASNPLCKE
jgi:tRNA(Ile)-lysidine synthetase-like protein